jgi:hypothetical protein
MTLHTFQCFLKSRLGHPGYVCNCADLVFQKELVEMPEPEDEPLTVSPYPYNVLNPFTWH